MNDFDELKFQPRARDFLAQRLQEGSLVLFLGSGASQGFGLPSWTGLIQFLQAKAGLPILTSSSSAEDLQEAAGEIEASIGKDELMDWIAECLYSNTNLNTAKNLNNPLLIAVAALLMGSKRGHVTRVVTLNYDNMLEWFLSLFGFVVKTIYQLPELEGSEDVRIYHPHGFIPNITSKSLRSNFVILSLGSVNERLGTPGEPWFEMVRHILNTGVCLFLGMSGKTLSDRALAPLFTTSGKNLIGIRPLGMWIIYNEVLNHGKTMEFDRNNIIPLVFTEVEQITEFLLGVCQKASETIS